MENGFLRSPTARLPLQSGQLHVIAKEPLGTWRKDGKMLDWDTISCVSICRSVSSPRHTERMLSPQQVHDLPPGAVSSLSVSTQQGACPC